MQYTEVYIKLKYISPFADIVIAMLNEIGFESYHEETDGVKAYIQTSYLIRNILDDVLDEISELTELSVNINEVKQENWNAEWERNYRPVIINDQCVIRAPFHDAFPDMGMDIIIMPKMSFGTGHHATTELMINEMLLLDFTEASVLDMGSGTGVLSILASKLGAEHLVGIDIDNWAFENAKDNAVLNNIVNVKFIHGDVKHIYQGRYDFILANINRNIILSDLDIYVGAMNDAANIIMSGFLEDDIPLILDKTKQLGLEIVASKNKEKWQMIRLRKG